MHKSVIYLLIALLLTSTGGYYFYEQQRSKPAGLIRLHIIANSNTFYDQALKYRVKDRIVSEMSPAFSQATDLEAARQIADVNLATIQKITEEEIKRRGFNYPVKVVRGNYYFPAKKYNVQARDSIKSLTLPPGRYEAVRVIIGSGEGANWWCVLYPPLCFVDLQQAAPPVVLPAASAAQEQSIEKITENNIVEKSQKPQIKYRFRLFELIKKTLHTRVIFNK
ncbi:Stage II sporulation protein R [Sporotomaculum syntrophicum]|uniref:Stage II sporulation protein R n=1 Tax=Sporotomaculum syntrophicum TaxID=182264 RepID=A0A9D2WRY6_9FIRM|nr:stage II sporulation protein R [Sporotomaculum syntrophicum]KAF1085821.1 Stage II sporulation protein R [Sporotomaculum syntrophicum]